MARVGDTELRVRLRASLTTAMKARETTAVAALRSALGAIDNAEAADLSNVPSPSGSSIAGSVAGLGAGEADRRVLSPADIEDVVRAEIDERRSASDHYEQLGQHDRALALRAEADILASHLSAW